MGNDNTTAISKVAAKNKKDNKTRSKPTFKTLKKFGRIKFDDIIGELIQIENTIIFLSQNRMSDTLFHHDDNDNDNDDDDDDDDDKENELYPKQAPANSKYIKLNKYNVKTKQLTDSIQIETEKYNIDIENCVYCMDKENNNLIYLINKNEEILTISTEKNEIMIKSLTYIDSGNKITDKPKDSKNMASLTMHNNKLIILGAIKKYNDNDNDNSNIEYIPYDLIKKKNDKDQLAIYKFGKLACIEYIAENNGLILMGGATRYLKTDVFIPTNIIWQCLLSDDMNYKWSETPLYLPDAMHSFGIIQLNLDRIRYIILFGGTHVHITKEKEEATNIIYALYLDKKYLKLTEKEIKELEENEKYKKKNKQKNNNNNKYHGLWFELNYQLPLKTNYYAFYDENIDKDTIHLITYNDGIHFILSYKELINVLETDKLLTEDGKDGSCHQCHPWTEAGKTVIPTKVAKLKSKGPRKKKKRNINKSTKGTKKKKKEIISSKKGNVQKNKNDNNGNDKNKDIGKGTDNVIPIKFKIKGGGPKDMSSTKDTIS